MCSVPVIVMSKVKLVIPVMLCETESVNVAEVLLPTLRIVPWRFHITVM